MRICSLVPGATEVVVMLGFGDSLVGISHECDYPASVRDVPIHLFVPTARIARTSTVKSRRSSPQEKPSIGWMRKAWR
jgi:hypothetical protein